MSNDEFYAEGGPLMIVLGSEWSSISADAITSGHIPDMARKLNGYLVYTEHRFYTQLKSTDNNYTEKRQLVDMQQALADLAYFVEQLKSRRAALVNAKVIFGGGCYSATLVTWLKRLYSHLAVDSWAASAALLAKGDLVAYKNIKHNPSIQLEDVTTCYARIRNAINELEAMINNRRVAEVRAMLKLCDNLDASEDLDIWMLYSEISKLFAYVEQAQDETEIQWICDDIMQSSNDVSGLINFLLQLVNSGGCNDLSYKAYLNSLMDASISTKQAQAHCENLQAIEQEYDTPILHASKQQIAALVREELSA